LRLSKLALFFHACVLVLGALTPRALGGEGPKEWVVHPLLPDNTWLLFTIHDKQKGIERFKQTDLWKLLNDADLLKALNQPFTMLKGRIAATEQKLGYTLDETFDLFQGEITVAMLGFTPNRNEQGAPIPDLLIAVNPRTKADAFMDKWNRIVDLLDAQTQNTLDISKRNVAGADVVTLGHALVPFKITYALSDGVFLMGLGEGRVEAILAAREAAKTAPDVGAPKTLAETPGFKRALERVGPNADLLVYANLEEIKKNPDSKLGPKTDREKIVWEMAGLNSVKTVTYAASAKDQGLHEIFFFDSPIAERKGLLALLDGPGLTGEALTQAPKNSLIALALQAEPNKLLDRLLEIWAVTNPETKQQAETAFADLNQKLGIDVRKDWISAFTGQAVFSVTVPQRHPKLGLGFPQFLLTLEATDTAKVQNALNAFRKTGVDKYDFIELEHGKFTIHGAREKTAQPGQDPAQMCWSLVGSRLVLSPIPLALRDELDRLEAGGTGIVGAGTGGLDQDPDFKSVRAKLSGKAHLLIYADTGALASAAYDTLVSLAQFQQKSPRFLDINLLPSSQSLVNRLGGTLMALSSDALGLSLESYSSTGVFTTLLPAAAALDEYKKRQQAAGMDLVPATKADLPPELAGRRQLLSDLAQSLQTYSREHGGAYPPTLTELLPKYLKAEKKAGLFEIAFNGKQDKPFKVVAYPVGIKGPLPILLQDGTVRVIHSGQLDQVLNTGWSGERAKPFEMEAAKPPQPPPDF